MKIIHFYAESRQAVRLNNFRQALQNCPPTGTGERRVHRWLLSMANLALNAGIGAEQWAAEVATHATRLVSADELREAWEKASGSASTGPFPSARPKIRPAPLSLADLIKKGGNASIDDFFHDSPVPRLGETPGWEQASTQLRALFLPDEFVFCGEQLTPGVLGKTVRTRNEWELEFQKRGASGEPLPPLFLPNPVSPVPAKTKDGRASLRCDASVVIFRHAVAEMDELPFERQPAFWMGRGLEDITTVTFSGHHSLHALVRVDVPDLETWNSEVRNGLFSRILVPLGCDKQCAHPSRLTRLAGAVRNDEKAAGVLQQLWFARKEAV